MSKGDGMAKQWAKAFYKSSAWSKCREGYIASVFGLCERCQSPGYIVHHKILLTPSNINDTNITLNWEHLEYLCLDCHNKEHHGSGENVLRVGLRFDANGELVEA